MDLRGGEPLLRRVHLGVGCFPKVDAEDVGQSDEVEQHIGDFLCGPRVQGFIGSECFRLVSGQPLEQLAEFADLTDQGKDQGFGVVELLPVAFGGEGAHAVAQIAQVGHIGDYATQMRVRVL